jgi:hypothetical protein
MKPKIEPRLRLEQIDKEVVPATERARPIISLSSLRPTPHRTVEEIRRTIRQKRFAEMTPSLAGED